jgi:hypothetical protein
MAILCPGCPDKKWTPLHARMHVHTVVSSIFSDTVARQVPRHVIRATPNRGQVFTRFLPVLPDKTGQCEALRADLCGTLLSCSITAI